MKDEYDFGLASTVVVFDAGVTAGPSTRRMKPFPLPVTVASTQSPIGMAGPVYGNLLGDVNKKIWLKYIVVLNGPGIDIALGVHRDLLGWSSSRRQRSQERSSEKRRCSGSLHDVGS